jgi:Flp pilus assembly pilin Flp
MKLFKLHKDESGAVTVDWVVLTAAIVGLGIAIIATVRTASSGLANKISTAIGTISPGT